MVSSKSPFLYRAVLLILIAFWFFTLGVDEPPQKSLRIILTVLFGIIFYRRLRPQLPALNSIRWPLLSFAFFLIFQGVRLAVGHPAEGRFPLFPPLQWVFYLLYFVIIFLSGLKRDFLNQLLWFTAAMGFFLAMNALPAFLINATPSYLFAKDQYGFFFPLFYFHEFIPKYVLGTRAVLNWTGDIIAYGFFSAFGLFFIEALVRSKEGWKKNPEKSVMGLLLPLLFSSMTAVTIFLFASRGTIVSFLITLGLYFGFFTLKYFSRKLVIWLCMSLITILGFLVWTGNLPQIAKELGTLEKEIKEEGDTSLPMNQEAAKRAIRMYQANAIWGVGTGAYEKHALKYQSPGTEGLVLPKRRAMCHYLHLLAEEGMGALFYFVFLILCLLHCLVRLFKTQSRFQFFAGLSFLAPVVLILGHSTINHLLQSFSMSVIFYTYLALSLASVHHDV